MEKYADLLKKKCGEENYKKLEELNNPALSSFIGKYVELCNPSSVFVRTDSPQDIEYLRNKAKELGEENGLTREGHTFHFDGSLDQARDKPVTQY